MWCCITLLKSVWVGSISLPLSRKFIIWPANLVSSAWSDFPSVHSQCFLPLLAFFFYVLISLGLLWSLHPAQVGQTALILRTPLRVAFLGLGCEMWIRQRWKPGAVKCHPSPSGDRVRGEGEQKAIDIFLITFAYAAVQTDWTSPAPVHTYQEI